MVASARTGRRSGSWRLVALSAAVLVSLAACGTDDSEGDATPAAPKMIAQGALTTTVDGSAVQIDYSNRTAALTIVHKLGSGADAPACVTSIDISVALEGDTCQLELTFLPAGVGKLNLADARFHAVVGVKDSDGAVIATKACPGWPAEKGSGEVIYELMKSDASLAVAPVPAGQGHLEKAKLDGLVLAPQGTVQLKQGGRLFSFDLAALTFSGDATSTGRTDVQCGKPTGQSQCATAGEPGVIAGKILKRDPKPQSCATSSDYDLGELCGASAIWLTGYHHWVVSAAQPKGPTFLLAHRAIYEKYKGQGLRAAFLVMAGTEKVIVGDPPQASGPSPTAEECLEIQTFYDLHEDVVMIYDKAKGLTSSDTTLNGTGATPFMVFARADGTIVATLPSAPGEAISDQDIETAIAAAMAAN